MPLFLSLLPEVGQEILGVIIMAITRHEGLVMVLLILHECDCRKEKHDYCFFPPTTLLWLQQVAAAEKGSG